MQTVLSESFISLYSNICWSLYCRRIIDSSSLTPKIPVLHRVYASLAIWFSVGHYYFSFCDKTLYTYQLYKTQLENVAFLALLFLQYRTANDADNATTNNK